MKVIGDRAFTNCDRLQSIALPPNLESLGTCSFFDCDLLEEVEILEGLVMIGEGAFETCDLEAVDLPPGLTAIEGLSFSGCAFTIPANAPRGIVYGVEVSDHLESTLGSWIEIARKSGQGNWTGSGRIDTGVEGDFERVSVGGDAIESDYGRRFFRLVVLVDQN